jgi:hypothetical protein
VDAFQREVCGHQGFVTSGHPKHGCVIADPGNYIVSLSRLASEAPDQCLFKEGHSESHYR